ncbi:HIT domain-containing protein [Campylobacter sp.]|uniref:HIT family protein n=1 Tax=Campylobacter sp. TaxID=205 RepID=UPI0026DC533C|nr:HIT domain-containing protein [Campylobacter sp.]MDO4673785.1 HIT domain-containing protein [Campylobacter sp.]
MDHLYAPWRNEYFEGRSEDCPFCLEKKIQSDEELGVIFRAKHCFGMMNRYPYSPGHFMIIPYSHEERIEALEEEAWQEMSALVRWGVKILKEHLKAGGVNIGMNLSADAGAGIAAHCHYHLVPRWAGDTNFITTIAHTRVYGSDKDAIYRLLFEAFKNAE